MLKFVENSYLIMLEKDREEKNELQKARKANEELKIKLKRLQEENSELKENFTKNEIDIITRKNELNKLLEILQRERKSVLEGSQRLQICKEQIDSINNFIDELRPYKEQLNFKANVTECLHDLLIKTKLRIAESEDILQQLHDHLTQLEYDVDKTKEVHKRGVGQWQDEFLEARLKEADVILEFDKLKREVAIIKHELEEKMLIRDAMELTQGQYEESSSKNSWSKKGKINEAILQEEEAAILNTVELQNEIDFLKQRLRKLENQQEDCEKKINSNEEIKVHLYEVRRSMWLREFETNQKIDNLRERYKILADKMVMELGKIQKNVEEKDLVIAKIQEKIKDLQKQNECLENDLQNSPVEDSASKLEDQKFVLEQEIVRLKNT